MSRQGAAAGRYRMRNEGQASQRGIQGMHILNDNAGCQIYRPTWNGTRTIFRPFPGKDPENLAAWDPFRLSDEDRDFGDWIRRYDMAFSIGNPGITFVMKDPRDGTLDDQQNPVWMLYRSIQQAVKAGTGHPSWNPLVFGGAGRAAPLSSPKDGYIMQGILMEHKSQPQNPPRGCLPDHQPVVLLMSQSAGQALMDKLGERDDQGNWRWPDLTSLDAGMFVQFHQAGTQAQPQGGAPRQMGATTVGGGGVAENRYEVEFLELYSGISPTFEGIHGLAESHVRPWDEIVRIPTIEDQVRMLCGAGIPATAIVYALGDVYQEFIPQHIFDQARAQNTQTTVPFQSVASEGGGTPNPMQSQEAPSPMGASPAATQQDPAMPAATTPPPTAAPEAAGNPMASVTQPEQTPPPEAAPAPQQTMTNAEAAPQAQPTHTTPERSAATQDALARARARAADAGG